MISCILLLSFLLWTAAILCIDVRFIGPNGTDVGFAALNGFVHDLTGVHLWLYTVTDWLGLVPLAIMLVFAFLGLVQLIRQKSLFRVDADILQLGVFYIIVLTCYLFFEAVVINYRPILIDGRLEASYPSSTTLLVLCVIPTAIFQCRRRISRPKLQQVVCGMLSLFGAFMVLGRLISGVHWLTDILGGSLLSAGLVFLYFWAVEWSDRKAEQKKEKAASAAERSQPSDGETASERTL